MNIPRKPASFARLMTIVLASTLVAMSWLGAAPVGRALAAGDPAVFSLGLNPGLTAGKPFAMPSLSRACDRDAAENLEDVDVRASRFAG